MNIVTRKLIAKEFYVNRWLIIGGALGRRRCSVLVIAAVGKMRLQHRHRSSGSPPSSPSA